ncbi:hypothetical protein D3C81_1438980 [compost metagenome]
MHAFLFEVLFAGQSCARAGLADQQRVGFQILQPQRAHVCQRVIRARHGNNRVVEERQEIQTHVLRHHRHDHQIVAVVGQPANHLATVDHGQLQIHFRVLTLERGEQVRHEVFGAGFHRQFQLALQRTLHVGQLHIEVFQTPEDVPAGALKCFGGFGHVEFFADVIE